LVNNLCTNDLEVAEDLSLSLSSFSHSLSLILHAFSVALRRASFPFCSPSMFVSGRYVTRLVVGNYPLEFFIEV
jgi:hypothetical protein